MNICITGASGFVGNYLVDYFLANGDDVLSISRAENQRRGINNYRHLKLDLRNQFELPDKIDLVIHCAAIIASKEPDADKLFYENIKISENIINAAVESNTTKFIFLSSMSSYGNISVSCVDEETPSNKPNSYGMAKKEIEQTLSVISREYFDLGISLRLPGIVGRGAHDNFLSTVMANILNNKPNVVFHPEKKFNNVVHVSDLAKFIKKLSNYKDRRIYENLNLGSIKPIKIKEVISILYEMLGARENVKYESNETKPFLISIKNAQKFGYDASTVKESIILYSRDYI